MAANSLNLDGAVVVCGAGAAGLAAALSAARRGARVALIEATSQIGGTVAASLIHTLGGLYDSEGQVLNSGLPAELIDRLHSADRRTRRRKLGRVWVLNVCPAVYRDVVAAWLNEQPPIVVLCNARADYVWHAGGWISELEIGCDGRKVRCCPRAVIDATGTAEVTRRIDPQLVDDDGPRSAGGLIVRLRGMTPGGLEFPKGLAVVRELRSAAAAGSLPRVCEHAWIDSGISEDEAFLKLMVPLGPRWRGEAAAFHRQAQDVQAAIVGFLRRRPEFAAAKVTATGAVGIRDGGRIRGRYTLTVDDVRQGRRFAGAAARCAWPIEYWNPDRGVSVEYLPPGLHYEIPMRALEVAGLENFWVAGKCLSADRQAHASARVVGACWAMGEAVGRAAATRDGLHLEEQHDVQPLRSVSENSPAAAGSPGDSPPARPAAALLPRAR